MNKRELAKKYGKERVQCTYYFLDKLNRLYGFPYSEQTLCDVIVSLSSFLKSDMEKALVILEDRESNFPLKFNEIKNACRDAKQSRIRAEKMDQPVKKRTGCEIPKEIKERFVNRILKKENK